MFRFVLNHRQEFVQNLPNSAALQTAWSILQHTSAYFSIRIFNEDSVWIETCGHTMWHSSFDLLCVQMLLCSKALVLAVLICRIVCEAGRQYGAHCGSMPGRHCILLSGVLNISHYHMHRISILMPVTKIFSLGGPVCCSAYICHA